MLRRAWFLMVVMLGLVLPAWTMALAAATPGEPDEPPPEVDPPPPEVVDEEGSTIHRGHVDEQRTDSAAGDWPEAALTEPPLIRTLIDDPITTEVDRQQLRLLHGLWDDLDADQLTHDQRARLALMRYQLHDPLLSDPATDAMLRGEAALLRGQPELTVSALEGVPGIPALVLRAKAYEDMGRLPDAVNELQQVRAMIDQRQELEADPAQITAAAEAIAMLARLEGRPAQDYQTVMQWLGRVYSEVDPLYWPARLTEAELLLSKDNYPEAFEALLEALSLNPRSGRAWYLLGCMSADTFDFARASHAIEKLHAINPQHVLADAVAVRSYLKQKDIDSARKVLTPALERYPTHRELVALLAATDAAALDKQAAAAALARFDQLAPGSPYAYFTVGKVLSNDRQYAEGEAMLREAINRAPAWAEPRLELGLLLMQDGNLPAALDELEKAAAIDRFHTRVNNQLTLARKLVEYPTIETEHFIIRWSPGPDEVFARDVAREVEAMYDRINGYFQHEPAVKTQLDLMPDTQHFAVRITGHPEVWTFAACTGDVVAMAPPNIGRKQHGTYDWRNVLGHEYTHTVTLGQTHNRIPHWATEGCAVLMETTGRTFDQKQLLAWATNNDELFPLDQINWGFIRPKRDIDRGLAYAQAAWMLEYLQLVHGHQAMIDLLNLWATGVDNTVGIERVTGESAEAFFSAFKAWAKGQVTNWGLDEQEPLQISQEDLVRMLSAPPDSEHAKALEQLISEHLNHRQLLRGVAHWAVDNAPPDEARQAVERYGLACPSDPWVQRALLVIAAKQDDVQAVLKALRELDKVEADNPEYAVRLAKLQRERGEFGEALAASLRALHREPYNGEHRTLAATIALQAGNMPEAAYQLESLAILEPDRAIHQVRLAALYDRMGRSDDAAAAARKALALDPAADVRKYLDR